jgi:hypothetical protein
VKAVIASIVLVCSACGHDALPPAVAPQTPEQRPLASARSLERLATSVGELEDATGSPPQQALARVLQKVGDAMEPLSHATNLRVQEVAQRLAGSPAASLSHAGLLKQALTLVLQSLITTPSPPGRETEYRSALRTLRASTQAIDDLVTLQNQQPKTLAAVHAAADAVFLARGGEAPFGEAERVAEPPAPIGSFEVELERARDGVSKLAQTGLTRSTAAAGDALAALGDLVVSADRCKRLGPQASEIRFEAERLERADPTQFGQAGWIRSGLESALDALLRLGGNAGDPASTWIRVARRAVTNIDEQTSISFQRAAIQDAFRATVDAFAALESSTDSASSETDCAAQPKPKL